MIDAFKEAIKREGKTILLWVGKESQSDPYEKNVSTTYYNPSPVKGIVKELPMSKMQWIIPGRNVKKGKKVIIPNTYRSILEKTGKITFDGDSSTYHGFRDGNA